MMTIFIQLFSIHTTIYCNQVCQAPKKKIKKIIGEKKKVHEILLCVLQEKKNHTGMSNNYNIREVN